MTAESPTDPTSMPAHPASPTRWQKRGRTGAVVPMQVRVRAWPLAIALALLATLGCGSDDGLADSIAALSQSYETEDWPRWIDRFEPATQARIAARALALAVEASEDPVYETLLAPLFDDLDAAGLSPAAIRRGAAEVSGLDRLADLPSRPERVAALERYLLDIPAVAIDPVGLGIRALEGLPDALRKGPAAALLGVASMHLTLADAESASATATPDPSRRAGYLHYTTPSGAVDRYPIVLHRGLDNTWRIQISAAPPTPPN